MPTAPQSSPALRQPLLTLVACAALACAGDSATDPDPPAPPPTTGELLISAATPIAPSRATAANGAELTTALRDIKRAIPAASLVHLFFEDGSVHNDWIAMLDVVQREGFRAVVGFAVQTAQGYEALRPDRIGGSWLVSSLGGFIACATCIRHPALYAVAALDEPWHQAKQPLYTTADLQSLYSYLKGLAPGVQFRILIQFSRELWRYIQDAPNPQLYWDTGICDIVQISALELQDLAYQFDLLDQNHYWSRRILHQKTPAIPLWSSVQVFGARYGPSAGYWFPRERDGSSDLTRLLDDLVAARYESEHPLTGLMLQKWDSEEPNKALLQYTIGDAYLAGQPSEQVQAAQDAVRALNTWLASRGTR